MKIVLVRHGQTAANRAHALDTARPGLPLTEEGFSQAEALARRWEEEVAEAPRVIAVSPLMRTRQTAAPLARKYGLQPLIRPGIRELRSGDVEMNANAFSDSVYIEGTGAWAHGLGRYRMGGGESGEEALARALPVVLEVAGLVKEADPKGVGAIVAHGAMLRLLASSLAENIEGELVMTHYMGNTGTVVLQWPDGFEVKEPGQLLDALTALTWNDRRVEDWEY